MKLLIVVDMITGGASNVAQILALHYAKKGEEVVLMFAKKSKVVPKYDLTGVTIIEAEEKFRFLSDIRMILKYRKLIKKIGPNIIISFLNTVSPAILFSQIMRSVPVIVSERSDPFKNTNKIGRKILRYLSYYRADLITVQFDVFKRFHKAAFKMNKIVTIPNMILPPKRKKDTEHIRSRVSFVTFATLSEVKRLGLMIKLFAKIHQRCPDTELNIYGEGPERGYLEDLVSELNLKSAIYLKGYVSDSHKYLAENDIYLMTSVREGFPNSLGEAMATGLPSVSFKCHDGLVELIQHGINGYLVNEGDIDNFCSYSEQLVREPLKRIEMGQAAARIDKYEYCKTMRIYSVKH